MRRPVMITDRHLTHLVYADYIAWELRRHVLFVLKGCGNSRAVYIFGKRVYKSGW